MITHNVVTTKTGLRVIQVPISGIKSVTVLALVNTGSRYEQPKWWGIAHFLEHMVFKGTEKYPDTQVLASTVDAVGAKWNAFTSKEYTGYYVKAASSQASLAIDVISELLLTPQIRQEDIDREKGVIVEEMNMYADMPAAHIANLYEQMIFDEKTLGHDIIGVRDTVNNLTATDFNEFIHQWYGLKNVVLILSGDPEVVGNAKTMTEIEKAFAKGNPGKRQAAVALEHLGDHPMTDKRFLLEYRKTEQAHFVLGFPSLSRKHPDRYAASLLSVVIGGSMSSRLFSEVREKRGLCYYIHSDLDFFHDTGMFGASAGVDPQRVEEALKVTIDQFA